MDRYTLETIFKPRWLFPAVFATVLTGTVVGLLSYLGIQWYLNHEIGRILGILF